MNYKKILYACIGTFIFLLLILFFYYKNPKKGNNITKSILDLKEYILNISSYEATISAEINSNKNTNRYIIKQWYASPNIFKQEVQAPENIKGLVSTFDGTNLKIENTRLNLIKLYDNYNGITNNILCLGEFIKECKYKEIQTEEINNTIKLKIQTENRYSRYKELMIDKETNLPIEMKVLDENKKTLVYILYNEITINNTTKEDII